MYFYKFILPTLLFIQSIFIKQSFSTIIKNNNLWSKTSWKNKYVYQNIHYIDQDKLNNVVEQISKCTPLIFAGEANSLKSDLVKAGKGEAFILMGGDCAETFREFNTVNIMNTYRVFLQMTLILMYGKSLPIIKIGRIAGQFAKPRSNDYETINNITLPAYRGDIVNSENFTVESRTPNPELMLKAYSQSVQTMNLIRALSQGGYADIERIHEWNLNFVENTEAGSKYKSFANEVKKTLLFLKALGLDKIEETKKAQFYTSHESLLLEYESAMTRQDSITNKYFDCSAHMIWIGERTRQLDGAHIEFARGIENPIGIKISEKCDTQELEALLRRVNPQNIEGKVVLIIRMGKMINVGLPPIVYMINRRKLNVVWISDPMHGNTVKLENGIKTRFLDQIKEEYESFYHILKNNNISAGGIHLEMTGRNVTECLDDSKNNYDLNEEFNNYESGCDPRLSASQCLDLAFHIANLS